MNDIHILSRRPKDLNLLVLLHLLLAEKNTSRVAKRLGITQSAVSHGLARLREQFDDDLLVRSGKGLEITPYAKDLVSKVTDALVSLDAVYTQHTAFSPHAAQGTFTIATTDYMEVSLIAPLVQRLKVEAPQLTVVARPALGALPKVELETGAFDLAIAGYFGELPEGFYQQRLFSDGFSSAVHRGHPDLKRGRLDLDAFAANQHVLISPQGDLKTKMDAALKKQGMSRRIVAAVYSFLSPAWFVAESDLVLTAPSSLLEEFRRYFPLVVFTTPLPIPEIHLLQVWHARTHRSPLHRWMRSTIESVAKSRQLTPRKG